MEALNMDVKAKPDDSFLGMPHLQDKKKKWSQPIEISSNEDDNATPTPKAVIYTPPPIPEIPVGFRLDSRILGEFWFCICFLNNSRNTCYGH